MTEHGSPSPLTPATPGPLLANLLTFVRLLRRAGLPVTPGQTLDLLRALELVDVGDRQQVFHAARSQLVTRRQDLTLFETLFNGFFGDRWQHPGPPQRPPRPPRDPGKSTAAFTIVDYPDYKTRHLRQVELEDRTGTFSREEALERKVFSELTDDELRTVRRMIQDLSWRAAERRTRRRERHRRGDLLDLRATLRHAARHGGVAGELLRARRRVKPRPLVVLADVSGSMETLSRLVLQFLYGLRHGLGEVEAFLFGTRLTRVTRELRLRNVDQALAAAARAVPDWSGGTRIGDSLATFRRRWGRRVLGRGAVVIVLSDGWERGDATRLRDEVRRLRHRCHRLIWLNPLAGRRDYEPRVEGMAAALPFIDDFLPVHDLRSLRQLADHLASLPRRRRGARIQPATPIPSTAIAQGDAR